jgi:diguanylate cyclase (GGDEF)-like protein
VSDADSAGVVQLSLDGRRELATVGAENGSSEVVRGLLEEVGAAGAPVRSDADGTVIAATPVRVDDETWGAIWVVGASAGAADPTAAAHVLGIGLSNLHRRAELRVQARTDALTGLANRRSYMEQLRREVALAKRRERPLSVAMIDIDHFKAVNDEFGHPAGDHTLAELAARLVAVARASDLLARVGGEEFAWLMPDTGLAEAWQAAERARRAISARPMPGGVGTVTISLGVADRSGADGAEELYANADAALYAAKSAGRDLVAVHEPERDVVARRAVQRTEAADAAAAIGRQLGWDDARVTALRSAATADTPLAPPGPTARVLRWDGGPKGEHPRGDEIPEEARVIAVADAWAALVGAGGEDPEDRARALAEMHAASGSAFWAEAVDALARVESSRHIPSA